MVAIRAMKNSMKFYEWSYDEFSPTICDAVFQSAINGTMLRVFQHVF